MEKFRRSLPLGVAWKPYPEEIVNNEIYSPEVKRRAIEAGIQEYQAELEEKEVCCRNCQYESEMSRWIAETTYTVSHYGLILRCPRCEIALLSPPDPKKL